MSKASGAARILLTVLALAMGGGPPARAEDRARPRPVLIGDSTVRNGTKGQESWGTSFARLVDQDRIEVENRAWAATGVRPEIDVSLIGS